MEKRVTCPNCEKSMTVNIWSETLTQVLKCSSCGSKFTYDPSNTPVEEKPEIPKKQPKKNGDLSVTRLIGKGIRNGISMAAAPVKTVKREMDRIVDSVNSITNSTPPKAVTSVLNKARDGDGDPGAKRGEEGGPKPREKPPGPRPTSKSVQCPRCTWVFQAGLPDNEKQVLTTKCPECSNIFSFGRDDPPVKEESVVRKEMETPGDDEGFAIPVQLKKKMEREQEEREREAGILASPPPDDFERSLAGPGGPEDFAPIELAPEPRQRKGPRGRLLSVMCPYCNESFGTPAPKNRGKVICPICEEEFLINTHGEYIAKKALGSFTGGLARILGVEAIRNYQETFRDSMEGMSLLRDRDNLRYHMRNYSGKAGFLLIVVSLLGILFAGSIFLSIPGSDEDDPSGTVILTGNVVCGLDLLEGASVNITDLDRHNETNSEGEFRFEGVSAGDHTLEVTAPGKGKLVVFFTIGTKEGKQGSKDMNLVLPENATEEKDLREERAERAGLVLGLQAVFIFIVALLAFMAGLLAIQGKRFHATLFLAGISIVTIGFFIGLVLAIVSVILIILGKREFIS